MKDRQQIRPFAILMTPWIKLESISMKMNGTNNNNNKQKMRIHIVNGKSARDGAPLSPSAVAAVIFYIF